MTPKLNLAEAFRYLLPGSVLIIYVYLWDPNYFESNKLSKLPEYIAILATLLIGTFIFQIYRNLFYQSVIYRAQDVYFKWSKKDNYRTLLINRYDKYKLTSVEAGNLYLSIRERFLSDEYKIMTIQAPLIHLMYISGFMAIFFAIICKSPECFSKSYLFSIMALILLASAFFSDKRFEHYEYLMLNALIKRKHEKVDKHVNFFTAIN